MEEAASRPHFISGNLQIFIPSFLKIIQEGLLQQLKGPLGMGFPPMIDKGTPWLTTRVGFIGCGGKGQPLPNRAVPAQGQAPLIGVIKKVPLHEILILFFSRLQMAFGTGIF
jgi:hypothetical protein